MPDQMLIDDLLELAKSLEDQPPYSSESIQITRPKAVMLISALRLQQAVRAVTK